MNSSFFWIACLGSAVLVGLFIAAAMSTDDEDKYDTAEDGFDEDKTDIR